MDTQTLELGNAKVRLRSDLRFTLHHGVSSRWYVVEDDARGQYFRIGPAEYAFLSLLDGKRTLDEAQADLASIPGGFALDEQQANGVAKWMIDSGLAESYASNDEPKVSEVLQSARNSQVASWLNPICWRVPLFNPDGLLTAAHRKARWLFGLPILVIWTTAVIVAISVFSLHWRDFQFDRLSAFSTYDAFWLVVAWLAMKLLHESAHGLTCKHYGGRVPQFGIMFLLFVPLPYVDVTSSWRFAHKLQRALTAAAGMLAEAFVAAIAAIIWCRAEPGPLQYHAGNIILAGTINTLVFNLNPLMRFDGYHILADFLDMPNLYGRARQTIKGVSKWVFFGTRFDPPNEPTWIRRQFLYLYGVAALVWQVLICIALVVAAANIFPGIGFALALLSLVAWLGIPIWKLARYITRYDNLELPNRRRFVLICGGLLAAGWLLLLAPAPPTIRAPIVVRQDIVAIRAKSEGRIAKVHCNSGERAAQGDLLVTLTNPELETQLRQLEIDILSIGAEADKFLADGDIELLQIAQEHLRGLLSRSKELRYLVESLAVRAEAEGIVLIQDASNLEGQYVQTGEEILNLCCSETCRAVALVAQADARWLQTANDSELSVMIWGQGGKRIPSTLAQVHPRASFDLPHAAFASTLGGAVSVLDRREANNARDNRSDSLLASGSQQLIDRSISENNSRAGVESDLQATSGRARQSLNDVARSLRTVQPQVQVEVTLSPEFIQKSCTNELHDGQTGILFASSRRMTLGSYFAESISGWFQEQFTVSHGL